MKFFIQKALFPTLILLAAFLLVLHCFKEKNETLDTNYILKAYKNTVALYNGEKLVKIYDDIVLNTLPEKDIYQFRSGLRVSSPEYADKYLEDFDS